MPASLVKDKIDLAKENLEKRLDPLSRTLDADETDLDRAFALGTQTAGILADLVYDPNVTRDERFTPLARPARELLVSLNQLSRHVALRLRLEDLSRAELDRLSEGVKRLQRALVSAPDV